MGMRIYGTIGPACHDVDTLVRLFAEGMTGIRLNLSHMSLADASGWISNIHQAYELARGRCGKEAHMADRQEDCGPEILMDLQGPELRIGNLGAGRLLDEGAGVTLVEDGANAQFDPAGIPVPKLILPELALGQEIMLDDGRILLVVERLLPAGGGCMAQCTVLRGGQLQGRKSIALPGTVLKTPTLTEGDLCNIREAKRCGITGVMLPFVRNREDLICLKRALERERAGDIRVFAKIENMDGVSRLPDLLMHCDEIVIARGDLGNAMPLWKLPVVQAQIAELCKRAGKPFMVVTQMLASMEEKRVPTRAEVSDIFRAATEGASSLMLTGETAAGKYPVEAMRYLVQTVREAEEYLKESVQKS